MSQGRQGLYPEVGFPCVTGFHQCVEVVKEEGPLTSPGNDAATRSSNGGVQVCATLSHSFMKALQKGGFCVLYLLEEATP